MTEPEDCPSEETIYGFHGSVTAAGLKIVDEECVPVDADGLRVALYDHWGILTDGDGYEDVRFALNKMGEVARSLHTENDQ